MSAPAAIKGALNVLTLLNLCPSNGSAANAGHDRDQAIGFRRSSRNAADSGTGDAQVFALPPVEAGPTPHECTGEDGPSGRAFIVWTAARVRIYLSVWAGA